jgi:16S rRNA (guanine966-N2)-methyltransferase
MRVIAGRAGGVRLVSPKSGIRPTMDRVKAAIFSSLGEMVIGARVLDLFAGTGALGIEALSRGAEAALFVDEDRKSIDAIERNLEKTKFSGRVRSADVFRFLKNAGASAEKFRIIFADPPYEKMKSGEPFTCNLLADPNLPELLEPGGLFVLEKSPHEQILEMRRWTLLRQKRYGATEVVFLSAVRDLQLVRRSLGEGGSAIE